MSQIDRLSLNAQFTFKGDAASRYFSGLWNTTAIRIEVAEGRVGAIAALTPLDPGTATTADLANAVNAIIAGAAT